MVVWLTGSCIPGSCLLCLSGVRLCNPQPISPLDPHLLLKEAALLHPHGFWTCCFFSLKIIFHGYSLSQFYSVPCFIISFIQWDPPSMPSNLGALLRVSWILKSPFTLYSLTLFVLSLITKFYIYLKKSILSLSLLVSETRGWVFCLAWCNLSRWLRTLIYTWSLVTKKLHTWINKWMCLQVYSYITQ